MLQFIRIYYIRKGIGFCLFSEVANLRWKEHNPKIWMTELQSKKCRLPVAFLDETDLAIKIY